MSRRIRKHANPFNVRTRLGRLDCMAVFGREGPLEVDLGCGGASYVFQRARNHPERDFVGLEVRKPLVEAAMARRDREGPPNVAVFYASANDNLDLAPPGVIQVFHIQFPNPCFKRRHWKRRILQPRSVRRMAELLAIGGRVFAQSDVRALAEEMYFFLESDGCFESRLDPSMTTASPFAEATEWERQHQAEREPIYRMLFEKVREPIGPVPDLEFRDAKAGHIAQPEAVEEGLA